jgi:2'-hydroxyisoflavone reductase
MRLLIIGGTIFVGYHIVESALRAGHEVTLFNRGQSNPDAFPQAEKLIGDRNSDLQALKGRRFDAVIDTSGYIPRSVKKLAELLADAVDQYTFISSISVYKEFMVPGMDESGALSEMEDPSSEDVRKYYGEMKVLSERTLDAMMPGRVLHVRAGLIAGPRDPMDRFTYWTTRAKRGGKTLAPGSPDDPIQFIDARDLADWTIRMVEAKQAGPFNVLGPEYQLTLQHFLDQCKEVTQSDAEYVWVDSDFLMEKRVIPWDEMPLWNPRQGETANMIHYMALSNEKAMAQGLRFRPLADTIRDTLDWDAARPPDQIRNAGLSAKKEQRLLAQWYGSRR